MSHSNQCGTENIYYIDLNHVCRLCLNDSNLQPLMESSLLQSLNDITSVEIKLEASLPNKICGKCVTNLLQLKCLQEFVAKCRHTQNILGEIKELESSLEEEEDGTDEEVLPSPPPLYPIRKFHEDSEDPLNEPEFISVQIVSEDVDTCKRCDICDYETRNDADLEDHRVTHFSKLVIDQQRNRCSTCGKVANKRLQCDECEAIEKPALPPPNICELCGKIYKRLCNLKHHIKSKHESEMVATTATTAIDEYLCDSCGVTFESNFRYRTHKCADRLKNYKCRKCNRTFGGDKYSLAVHMGEHFATKSYKCQLCARSFHRLIDRQLHRGVSHRKCGKNCKICGKRLTSQRICKCQDETAAAITLACGRCDRKFLTRGGFAFHIKNFHL